MALRSPDAVTLSAAVATRSRADGSRLEGHTSLSTALVGSYCTVITIIFWRNYSPVNVWKTKIPMIMMRCVFILFPSFDKAMVFFFSFILSHFYVGSMYDDIRLHVARSYTSSADSPFSLMSSFTLSNHLLLGLPLFLLPCTFITIALLPT